jgi:hypothetical protein
VPTVRDLRRRWKPVKEGPAAAPEHEPVRIRLHRCFSWMQRVETVSALDADGAAVDAHLIFRWTALNALYGRWDADRREPAGDRATLHDFTSRITRADADGRIGELLRTHRPLLESLVGDEFLLRHFWEDPEIDVAGKTSGAVRKLRETVREARYARTLDDVLGRVYFLRCQLVHGAATFNGRQNRGAVRRAARFLELLLPELTTVIIDHDWSGDWGGLCYPPQR